MADKKISELDAVGTSADTDQIPVVQSGTTKRATLAQLMAAGGVEGLEAAMSNTVVVEGDSTSRATRAAAVDSAIGEAGTDGKEYVFVPHSFLDYDASAVNFTKNGFSGRLIREGQVTDAYDVKAYGAAGDGSTDDTDAIKAWRDAVEASGGSGVGVAPAGTYNFSGPVTFTVTDRTYYGSGPGVTTFRNTAMGGEDGFHLQGTAPGFIEDIEFRDMSLTGNGSSGDGFLFELTGRCRLRNVIVDGHGAHGINVQNSFAPRFRDVQSNNNGSDGLRIEDGTDHKAQLATVIGARLVNNGGWGLLYDMVESQIAGSMIDVTASENTSGGMKFASIKGVKLYGCWFEDNSNVHVQLGDSGPKNCIATIIEGCYFLQNDASLPHCIDANTGKKLRVEACRFQDATDAVRVASGFQNVSLLSPDIDSSMTFALSHEGTGVDFSATEQDIYVGGDDERLFYDGDVKIRDGNLAIGASDPQNALHIARSVPVIRLDDTDGAGDTAIINAANGALFLDTATGEALHFRPAGTEEMTVEPGGVITMANLPTSDPTNPGQLWNDAGTLKVSSG